MGIKLNFTPEEINEMIMELDEELKKKDEELIKFVKADGEQAIQSVIENLKTHELVNNSGMEYDHEKYKNLSPGHFYMLVEAMLSFGKEDENEDETRYDFHAYYRYDNETIKFIYLRGQGGQYVLSKPTSDELEAVTKKDIIDFNNVLSFFKNM